MNIYQEKLAPIFTQIILQRKYEQQQILRDAHEFYRSHHRVLCQPKHDLSRYQRAVREVKELLEAHQRIKDNSYGKCSQCGAHIDLLRLNQYPATQHCLSCDAKSARYSHRVNQGAT